MAFPILRVYQRHFRISIRHIADTYSRSCSHRTGTDTVFQIPLVSKSDLNVEQNEYWALYSKIVMILYFPLGLICAICGIIQVAGLCCSIIGIPSAIVIAKSLGTYLNPVNKKCVPAAVVDELERRDAQKKVDQYLN